MKPIDASKKANEKEVYFNLQHRRVRQQPKLKLGHFVRTADIKKVFSKGDSTLWSYKVYTITEINYDTIPTYRKDFSHGRYNEKFITTYKINF